MLKSFFVKASQSATKMNDLVYISLLQSYLSTILLDQGNIETSKNSLSRALAVGRALKFIPSIGVALVVLGQLRIAQAQVSNENNTNLLEINKHRSSVQMLQKAKKSLKRALALDGLEAETRTEGQLALAQVTFLLGEIEAAWQQTLLVIEETNRFEQTWLLACAQRLLGCILAAQNRHEDAAANFEKSLEILKLCGMRLE